MPHSQDLRYDLMHDNIAKIKDEKLAATATVKTLQSFLNHSNVPLNHKTDSDAILYAYDKAININDYHAKPEDEDMREQIKDLENFQNAIKQKIEIWLVEFITNCGYPVHYTPSLSPNGIWFEEDGVHTTVRSVFSEGENGRKDFKTYLEEFGHIQVRNSSLEIFEIKKKPAVYIYADELVIPFDYVMGKAFK